MKIHINHIKKYLKLRKSTLFMLSACIIAFFFARIELFGGLRLFAPALLCACACTGAPLIPVAAGGTVGIITTLSSAVDVWAYLFPYMVLCVIVLILRKNRRRLKKISLQLLISVLHLPFAIFLPFITYERILYIISIALSSLCIELLHPVCAALPDSKKRFSPRTHVISLALFTGLLLSGASDIFIGNTCLGGILCVGITICAAFLCGGEAGAATGALVGLALCAQTGQIPFLCAVLALSGVICGAVSHKNKYLAAFVFAVSYAIITLLFEGYILPVLAFTELLGGITVFLCIPKRFYLSLDAYLKSGCDLAPNTPKHYVKQHNNAVEEKLRSLSNIFMDMSGMLGTASSAAQTLHSEECADTLRKSVCADCIAVRNCELSQQLNEFAVELCNGQAALQLHKQCIRFTELERSALRIRDAARLQRIEQAVRTDERQLVAGELSAVAQLMNSIADDTAQQSNFDESTERLIREEMSARSINVKEVFVCRRGRERLSATLICQCSNNRIDECIHLVSQACERKMLLKMHTCSNDLSMLCFEEAPHFNITSGISRRTKTDSDVSGDNYTVRTLGTERYLIAVSDGMGSGKEASAQSEIAIELIESFYLAGFDQAAVLDAVNRLMMLKSTDESYATLDLCLIDRHSGKASFIKVGASGGYIKRGDRLIHVIPEALPLGVVDNLLPFCTTVPLQDNDYIILMSDGVTESSEADIADWLKKSNAVSPQRMADLLMEYCLSRTNGRCPDDMTVIISRIKQTDGDTGRKKKTKIS